MSDEQFNQGLAKYREIVLKIDHANDNPTSISDEEEENISDEEAEKSYSEAIEQKLCDDFQYLIDARFSAEGYFVKSRHEKCFTVIVYGSVVLGLDIDIVSYSYPNFKNRQRLDEGSLLSNATFSVSKPWETIGLNRDAVNDNPMLVKITHLMTDMVNNYDAKFYSSGRVMTKSGVRAVGLFAALDTGESIDIGYGKGTLTIKKLSNFEFFLGGFSAIVESELGKSVQNKLKLEKREVYKKVKRISFSLFIISIFVLLVFGLAA